MIVIGIIILIIILKYYEFSKSNYKSLSGNKFIKTMLNKGYYGEYKVFLDLEKIDVDKYLIPNIYLEKKNNETTEIDLIMIYKGGILVFEIKNYNGWIYGNEKNMYWNQTFNKNSKYKFYNPIWQNQQHINEVKNYLNITNESLIKNIVVFTNKAELKKIEIHTDAIVINRRMIKKTIINLAAETGAIIHTSKVTEYYNRLYNKSLVSNEVKKNHIENVIKYK